ncbi:MAG TPA: AI-2E family transporter [Terriglobia bacterium]|jgi:predicted PurR-regulated permease PerM|nr:AI-2E family transporter [Terriglobia bacterium]
MDLSGEPTPLDAPPDTPPTQAPVLHAVPRNPYTLGFLILAGAVSLWLCYVMAQSFVSAIIFAAVMAVVFYPIHLRIWSRIRGPNLAAFVSTLFVLLVVVLPVIALGTAVEDEIHQAYSFLSVRSAQGGGWVPWMTQELQKPLDIIGRHVDLSGMDLRADLQSRLEEASAWIVRSAADVARNLGTFILDAAISFFTLFFLFREGRRVRLTIAALLPLDQTRVDRLFSSITDTIIANVYGVLAVAAVQGSLIGGAFAVLDINSPILWGMVTAICSLIPVVGTALIWLPASIVLVATSHWIKGLILLVWGAGFVSLVDHAVRPYVIGGRVKMNTLFVFFSLLGGIKAFGILGVFVGPLILSITISLLGMLREEMRYWQVQPAREDHPDANGPAA